MKFARPMPSPPTNGAHHVRNLNLGVAREGRDAKPVETTLAGNHCLQSSALHQQEQAVKCFFAIDVSCSMSIQAVSSYMVVSGLHLHHAASHAQCRSIGVSKSTVTWSP